MARVSARIRAREPLFDPVAAARDFVSARSLQLLHGGPNQYAPTIFPPGTIIPTPPVPPGDINSQEIHPTGAWSLAAGQYLYVYGAYLFNPAPDSFDNQGSIFLDMSSYGELTMTWNGAIPNVKNSGVIVARTLTTDFNHVALFGGDTFDNSGQIFAISLGGFARVIWMEDGHSFVCSGLLASYSGAAGTTTVVSIHNQILNTASGKILAEGVNSV